MKNLYPAEFFDPTPVQPEAGRMTDVAIKLGMRAIESEAVGVAHIEVPQTDIETVLNSRMSTFGILPSSPETLARLEQERLVLPHVTNIVRRVIFSFDTVLEREAELHDLHSESMTRVVLTNDSKDYPRQNDWHIDAGFTDNKPALRLSSGWKKAAPTNPRYVSDPLSDFGVVRYVLSVGDPKGSTEFALGNYSAADMKRLDELRAASTQFPAGTVVRFNSERAIHARSWRVRPRIFVTNSLLRSNQKYEALTNRATNK